MNHWDRFQKHFVRYPNMGFSIDISRMAFEEDLFANVADRIEQRRFKAKPGECLNIDLLGQTPSQLILVGLGAPADFGPEQLRGPRGLTHLLLQGWCSLPLESCCRRYRQREVREFLPHQRLRRSSAHNL